MPFLERKNTATYYTIVIVTHRRGVCFFEHELAYANFLEVVFYKEIRIDSCAALLTDRLIGNITFCWCY